MKIHYKPICTTMVLLSLAGTNSWAQRKDVNYDESKVPPYTLPALLTTESGQPVTDRKSVVSGKSVSVRVDLGGRRIIKKKKKKKYTDRNIYNTIKQIK